MKSIRITHYTINLTVTIRAINLTVAIQAINLTVTIRTINLTVTIRAINLTVDSLPFTAADTATAVLPRGAKMRFDWLTEYDTATGIVSGNRAA